MILIALVMISCSSEPPAPGSLAKGKPAQKAPRREAPAQSGPAAPVVVDGTMRQSTGKETLELEPKTGANVKTVFRLVPKGFSLPTGEGEDRVVWYINGSPVAAAFPDKFDAAEYMPIKGDVVQAQAFVGNLTVTSNPSVIKNSRPETKRLEIRRLDNMGGGFRAYVETEDLDGDLVNIEYRWMLNGIPAGDSEVPALQPVANDRMQLYVKLYDGEDYSVEEMIEASLINQAPRIAPDRTFYVEGNHYIYNTTAEEPDGETMTFSLEGAPEGMSVDSVTGQVTWTVPADFFGRVDYKVVATDSKGASASLPVSFSVSAK